MHANVIYFFFMHAYMKNYHTTATFAELKFAEVIWVRAGEIAILRMSFIRGEQVLYIGISSWYENLSSVFHALVSNNSHMTVSPVHTFISLFFLLLFPAKRCVILASNRDMKIWVQDDRHWWQAAHILPLLQYKHLYCYLNFLISSHWCYNTVSGFIVIKIFLFFKVSKYWEKSTYNQYI